MLEQLAARSNIKIGTIWRPLVNVHYTFSYDKKKKMVFSNSKNIEKYVFTYKANNGYKWPHKGKIWNKKTYKWEEPSNTKVNPPLYSHPLEFKSITEEQFKKQYNTCAYCDDILGEAGYLTSIVLDENMAICEACASLVESCGMPFSNWKEQ